jgi:zinc protease
VEPTQDGERSVTVRRVGDIQVVGASYHVPPAAHPEAPAIEIMAQVLGDTPSGRLYKNLVETKKAVGVFNINFEFKEPSFLMFIAQLGKDASIESANETLLQTIENMSEKPPTKEEVDRAKTSTLKNIELTLNDPNRVGLGLSEYIAQGDWRLFFLYRDRLEKVTPEDVAAVGQKYLKRSNRTTAMFIPTAKPDRSDIPNVSNSEISAMVDSYKGKEAVAQGEAFDPSPANIDSRTTRSTIGGLKVAYLPKENRGDTVFANMTLHFGNEKSLMSRGTAASFVGQLLMRGTKNKTRQQIQDELDRLKARVQVFGAPSSAFAAIETTRENLPDVIKLVTEILKEPAFPESEFNLIKEETLTNLESQRSEPTNVAIKAMTTHFNHYKKGDVRYSGTLDEDIADTKAVTLDQVKAFYKDFYGASNGEAAFVGDFDPKVVTPLLTQSFGSWKSPSKYERLSNEFADIPAVNQTFETPDKANAFFFARLNVKLRDDNPDYPALFVGNYILGGGFLNSRLASRIRQKEGLSYGVGSRFGASSLDESAGFSANAIYAPQNVVKLEAAFKEEMTKAMTEGFTQEEVDAAKKGLLLDAQRRRAADSAIASSLTNYLNLGRTFKWDADFEKQLESVTVAQINAAMAKYITLDKISIFKAGDFAKAAK